MASQQRHDKGHVDVAYEKTSANLELAPRNLVKALTVPRWGEGIHLTGREAAEDSWSQG